MQFGYVKKTKRAKLKIIPTFMALVCNFWTQTAAKSRLVKRYTRKFFVLCTSASNQRCDKRRILARGRVAFPMPSVSPCNSGWKKLCDRTRNPSSSSRRSVTLGFCWMNPELAHLIIHSHMQAHKLLTRVWRKSCMACNIEMKKFTELWDTEHLNSRTKIILWNTEDNRAAEHAWVMQRYCMLVLSELAYRFRFQIDETYFIVANNVLIHYFDFNVTLQPMQPDAVKPVIV